MDLMSTSQLLGNIGEFLGSIAVFATLIYLSIQVKHSKQATEANTNIAERNHSLALAQSEVARIGMILDQVRSIALSEELAEIFVKFENAGLDGLSKVEYRRFQNWHIAQYYTLDVQHSQYRLGLLDEDSWQDAVRKIKAQVGIWDQLNIDIVGRQAFAEEVARIRES
jgi:hypothetical protein